MSRSLRLAAAYGAGLAVLLAACWLVAGAKGYLVYIMGAVALTVMVGVGLNVLLGLTGQVSLGHVGFYAIGAYGVAILTTKAGMGFWLAWPLSALFAGLVGTLLALPALRVTGPYLAMITIAFGFIVENGAVEWKALTDGANGIMNIPGPKVGGSELPERWVAVIALVVAALTLAFFERFKRGRWGLAMLAAGSSETAAQSIGINPVAIRTVAFALSAVLAGLAGGLYTPLNGFVGPSAFPFFQSILFLLVVIIGGAGTVLGPLAGAVVVVLLPEALASLAEYRLLLFGALLLVVLWAAPQGIVGGIAAGWARLFRQKTGGAVTLPAGELKPRMGGSPLEVRELSISFGGVRAVQAVDFDAKPGQVTSVIGPNGAGKTTLLNLIGGFYRPDAGQVKLGGQDLAGRPSHLVARAGIARTYQTTQLFGSLSVVDNIRLASLRGRLGEPVTSVLDAAGGAASRARALELLGFVGYVGDPDAPAAILPHGVKRLVEIARALATEPAVLLLDEPAAGLRRADTDGLGQLLRRIAGSGIAVVLVEHDMDLVMGVSDQVVVLDAGRRIAAGSPADVRADPAVIRAYLGEGGDASRPRATPLEPGRVPVLQVEGLDAGYGAIRVLEAVSLDVAAGEFVAVLGANGAGKTTLMKSLAGLIRPVSGAIRLDDRDIADLPAHRISRDGLVLVPEGRQVFPELSVADNIRLGAHGRKGIDVEAEVESLLNRFPLIARRRDARAGTLSGGEQQMLALARALIARPRMLLLDEPSLGLAPQLIAQLFEQLGDLRDEGVTILLVDQMAGLALGIADRCSVLEQGRIVRAGTVDDIRGDAALEKAYLG